MNGLFRLVPLLGLIVIASAEAASPPQVAFERSGTPYAIVRLDQNGSDLVELTRTHAEPSPSDAFSWSPDGTRLVYASRGIVGGDLYVIDADGAAATRITTGGGNQFPAWSPDDRSIAYVHTDRVPQPGGLFRLDEELWLVAPDGRAGNTLTRDRQPKREPEWSPDGSRILYSGAGTSIVDAASGRLLLHTGDGGGSWSPDGRRIAVATGRGIDILGADGTGRRTVAESGAAGPEWSPNGTFLAFTRSHCTVGLKGLCGTILHSVYAVGSNGRGERRLTGPIGDGPGSRVEGFPNDDSDLPAWWPDGSQLFFTLGGRTYAMNADGTCQRPFGPMNLSLRGPAWRSGARPTVPPLRCIDVVVGATPVRSVVGLRGDARIALSVDNDGNETASGLKLTLRLDHGRGRIRAPLGSCRGESVVECDLPALAAGGTMRLMVAVARPRPLGFQLRASVSAGLRESDPATNTTPAGVAVLACDVVGTDRGDWLRGTPGRDSICGRPGPDVIHAGTGNDRVEGGSGSDALYPGRGRDLVSAADGADRIYARDGERDVIDCGPGRDTVRVDPIDRLTRCERVVGD